MRLLFVTASLPTHYFPMVPFAWACRAAGHDVMVATHEPLVDVVVNSGLPAVPVGGTIDFMALHSALLQEGTGYDPKRLFLDIAEAMADELVAFARGWQPDVVVWDPAAFAGPVAAAAVGAASVRYLWGPDILGRPAARAEVRPRLALLFDRYGLELPDDPRWWTVDPCPTALQPPVDLDRLPVRYTPYSQHRELPDALLDRRDRPRVCLTMGTNLDRLLDRSEFPAYRVAASLAEQDIDVDLLVAPGQRGLVEGLPPNVRVIADCPLDSVLPGCVAMVNHGGSGTMLTAALHGVPQLFVPPMPDLRFNAELFSRVGAGRVLAGGADEADDIRAGLRELLDEPSFAESARLLAEDMRARPTPSDLVPVLENLALSR